MKDITGQRFGQLTALRPNYKDSNGEWRWVFLCTCGNEVDATPRYLARRVQDGHVPNCGCSKRSRTLDAHQLAARVTHHPLYGYWARMVDTCSNPKNPLFKESRAYGIKVCDAWRHSPETFFKDMEPLFDPSAEGQRFVRLLRHKDYEPGNVAWVSASEANDNQDRCLKIDTPEGQMSITRAAKRFKLNRYALRRAVERGESLEPFFGSFTPKQPITRKPGRVLVPTPEGELLTLTEASRRSGVGRVTIYERMKRGWPVDRLLEPRARSQDHDTTRKDQRPDRPPTHSDMVVA